MRCFALGLAIAASVCGWTAESAAGLCAAPSPWPGDAQADVAFTGVDAFQSGRRGDGPNAPMPVFVNSDVLGLGGELALTAGGLAVDGRAICVRYRPEWLGFILSNQGASPSQAVLTIAPVGGMLLEADLPRLLPGESRRVLVMGGEPISAVSATALTMKSNPENGESK